MPLGLFDWVDKIYTNTNDKFWDSLGESDYKAYNQYMINRFVSMNPNFTDVVNLVQSYDLDDRTHFLFYCSVLPRGKQFNKYIKATKEETYPDWLVDIVRKHYEVSSAEATEYIYIFYLTDDMKEELRTICEMYGTDQKLIKKAKI